MFSRNARFKIFEIEDTNFKRFSCENLLNRNDEAQETLRLKY